MDLYKSGVKDLPSIVTSSRHFTLARANRALVLVRRVIGDVMTDYQRVLDEQEIMEAHQANGACELASQSQQAILAVIERLQSLADELTDMGVEMKDWATGVVDFPAVAGGKEIRLCWRNDEQFVSCWHGAGDDCECRRKIDELFIERLGEGFADSLDEPLVDL